MNFLIELQALDKEVYALTREKSGIPGQLKKIEESLEAKKIGIKQAEENLKSLQLKLKDKEVLLQQKEEQIAKLQIQLYQLKTNKEYSAMLTEIGGIKADNSLIEEDIIKLMDEIDGAKKNISQEKGLFKEEEVRAEKEKQIIDARLKEVESGLSELHVKRSAIIPHVDKHILVRYEKVLKNKDGLALVPVEGGACGGCHMNLPPQVISDVRLKEDIIVCGSCLRILYIEDNVEIN